MVLLRWQWRLRIIQLLDEQRKNMTEKRKEKAFGYADIKVGDKLEIIDIYPDGTEVSITGVAHFISGFTWKTADNFPLLDERLPTRCVRSVELLSRPDMPVKTGTIISAITKDSVNWVYMVRVDKSSDSDELVWLELSGTGDTFRTQDEIVDWNEMQLVSVNA